MWYEFLIFLVFCYRYIAPEQVPVAFGGLDKDDDPDFTTADAATDVALKPSSKESIEIPVSEVSFTFSNNYLSI